MQTIRTATVKDIAAALRLGSEHFKIGITNVGVIDGRDLMYQLIAKNGNWMFEYEQSMPYIPANIPEGYDQEHRYALSWFYLLWDGYVTTELNRSVARAIQAINSEYDPIENYNKMSEIKRGSIQADETTTETPSGEKTTTDTDSGEEKNVLKKENDIVRETEYGRSDTNSVTSYDNTDFRNNSKDELGGTDTETESYGSGADAYTETNTKTFGGDNNQREHTKKETFGSGDNAYSVENAKQYTSFRKVIKGSTQEDLTGYEHMYEETKGNIGVTTTQQMIGSSIDLALRNLTSELVRKFVIEYLFI